MQTIMTAGEGVRHSPETSKFPPSLISPHIYQKEQTLVRQVLGQDFYDLLVADLVSYTGLTTWSPSQTYSTGAFVDFYGLILKSLVDGNTVHPCEDTAGTNWAAARRFNTDCYEDLWAWYLRPYLSAVIMASALDYATYPAGAKGVVEWADDASGARSASMPVFLARKTKLLNDAAEILENMKAYMIKQDNDGTCDFSTVPFVDCNNPRVTKTPRRRFLFRKTNY